MLTVQDILLLGVQLLGAFAFPLYLGCLVVLSRALGCIEDIGRWHTPACARETSNTEDAACGLGGSSGSQALAGGPTPGSQPVIFSVKRDVAPGTPAWQLLQPLVQQYGSGILSQSMLHNPEFYHFYVAGKGSLVYCQVQDYGRCVVAGVGDPLAAAADWESLTQAFLRRYPRAAFLHASASYARLLAAQGYLVNELGRETVIQARTWSYTHRTKTLRRSARQARQAGVSVREVSQGDLTPAVLQALERQVTDSWLQQKVVADRYIRIFVRHVEYQHLSLQDGTRLFVVEEGGMACTAGSSSSSPDRCEGHQAHAAAPPKPKRRGQTKARAMRQQQQQQLKVEAHEQEQQQEQQQQLKGEAHVQEQQQEQEPLQEHGSQQGQVQQQQQAQQQDQQGDVAHPRAAPAAAVAVPAAAVAAPAAAVAAPAAAVAAPASADAAPAADAELQPEAASNSSDSLIGLCDAAASSPAAHACSSCSSSSADLELLLEGGGGAAKGAWGPHGAARVQLLLPTQPSKPHSKATGTLKVLAGAAGEVSGPTQQDAASQLDQVIRPLPRAAAAPILAGAVHQPFNAEASTGAGCGGSIKGFLLLDPLWSEGCVEGYVTAVLRTMPDAHPGAIKLLVEEALSVLAAEGKATLNFGFSPFWNSQDAASQLPGCWWVHWVGRFFFHCGNNLYAFKNLAFSKTRYGGGLTASGAQFRDPHVHMAPVYVATHTALPGLALLDQFILIKFVGFCSSLLDGAVRLARLRCLNVPGSSW